MAGEREVIFDLMQIGRTVKVTAADTASGMEASIVGDPAAGEPALRRLPLQKLTCVMERRAGEVLDDVNHLLDTGKHIRQPQGECHG